LMIACESRVFVGESFLLNRSGFRWSSCQSYGQTIETK
jgi:hypothetical protein